MPEVHRRPTRKPRSRYHHGDLRRALVEEAVRTIGRGGVEELTLRDIGQRLGVSRTALYRHFADKGTLLATVARDGFEKFRTDLVEAWSEAPGTTQGFELMGAAYVRFAVANPSHYRVMFGDYRRLCAKDPELQAAASAAFAVLVDALGSLQAARLVRQEDVRLQAHFVWALVHGVAMLAINGQLGPALSGGDGLAQLVQFALLRMRTGLDREDPVAPHGQTTQ